MTSRDKILLSLLTSLFSAVRFRLILNMEQKFSSRSLPIVGIVALLLIGFFLIQRSSFNFGASTQTPTPTAKQKVNMGRSKTPGIALPTLIAEKKGIFDKYNLDIKSQVFERGYQEAVIAGQLDVMVDGTATFLAAAVGGADLKMVGVTLQRQPYYVIGRKGLKPEDIRRVAINRFGGEGYYMTLNALRLWGVDISKLKFEAAGLNEAQYVLLVQNKVDVSTFQATEGFVKTQKEFTKDGNEIVFNAGDHPQAYYPWPVVTRADYLKNNPEVIRSVLLSLKEAIEFARANKDGTLKIFMDEYGYNQEDASFIYNNFLLSTEKLDMKPKVEFFRTLLGDMAIENKEAPNYDLNKYIDTSLTP